MGNYTDRAKIELVYGALNIQKWADLDNDKDPNTIDARITWAAEQATVYLDGRLALGKYLVPFETTPSFKVPKIVQLMASILAGIFLYEGRLVISADQPRDQISRHKKQFAQYLRQLLSGQLKLFDPISGLLVEPQAYNAPSAFVESVDGTDSDTCSCGCCSFCVEKSIWKESL